MTESRKTTKIIVVGGGGTLGSSTALHLLRAGYTPANITVLDVYPIPSAQSAGNDLNKIMSVGRRNEVTAKLELEALEMWKEDEVFSPFFHQTGRLDCASTSQNVENLRKEYQSLIDAGGRFKEGTEWLDSEDKILKKAPVLERRKVQGWKAIYSRDGGWLAAAKAINAVGEVLKAAGVCFASGDSGTFQRPLFRGNGLTVVGIETVDGFKYYADKVVIAAGSWSPVLIDLEEQCCSKAWVYAHLHLTAQEAAAYKGSPVVYNGEVGFFFEPTEDGVIKVCDEFPGFTRFQDHRPFGAEVPKRISVPRSHAKHLTDTYPDASEVSIRKAIDVFFPHFNGKELHSRTLCWCADTADSDLLICEHPQWKNLFVASGDSGHSFKLLPVVGRYVVELLEGTLAANMAHTWRWRPGGDALTSTRGAPAKDLADMPGWKDPKQG